MRGGFAAIGPKDPAHPIHLLTHLNRPRNHPPSQTVLGVQVALSIIYTSIHACIHTALKTVLGVELAWRPVMLGRGRRDALKSSRLLSSVPSMALLI